MAYITRVVVVPPQQAISVVADQDWKLTAVSVRAPNLSFRLGDGTNESHALLREPQQQLNANILLVRGTQLIFENESYNDVQCAFFSAEAR